MYREKFKKTVAPQVIPKVCKAKLRNFWKIRYESEWVIIIGIVGKTRPDFSDIRIMGNTLGRYIDTEERLALEKHEVLRLPMVLNVLPAKSQRNKQRKKKE